MAARKHLRFLILLETNGAREAIVEHRFLRVKSV